MLSAGDRGGGGSLRIDRVACLVLAPPQFFIYASFLLFLVDSFSVLVSIRVRYFGMRVLSECFCRL